MGAKTGIAWCDRTFNAWVGCTKVSDGCKFCYAERDNERYHWTDKWGPDGTRHKTKTLPQLIAWNKQEWFECFRCCWRGSGDELQSHVVNGESHQYCPNCETASALRAARQRVFVNSLSDLYEDRPELTPWRNEFFAMSQACSNLDFLLLTKRPENIAEVAPRDWCRLGWPANIWLGVSAENQATADARLPELVKQKALRWISVEPMLGPLQLQRWLPPRMTGLELALSWVVVGGESGPHCRPLQLEWVRDLLRQCQAAGVPFFAKQIGGFPDRREKLADWPGDLRWREWPITGGKV